LDLLNVEKALEKVPVEKYVDVGNVLGLSLNRIKVFETNYNRDIKRVWKEIIQSWLDSSSNNTWFILAEKLSENGYSHCAEEFAIFE